jgi:Spy/CpxP family protein refolding chaperone
MVKKWIIYLVLFLLAINIAMVTTLLIKERNPEREEVEIKKIVKKRYNEVKFHERLSEELQLSEGQKAEIEELSVEFRSERRVLKKGMNELRKAYFEELAQASPDTNKLNNHAREIGVLESKKIKMEYQHYRNIRDVCNSEQAARFDSLGKIHMHRHFSGGHDKSMKKGKRCEKIIEEKVIQE